MPRELFVALFILAGIGLPYLVALIVDAVDTVVFNYRWRRVREDRMRQFLVDGRDSDA